MTRLRSYSLLIVFDLMLLGAISVLLIVPTFRNVYDKRDELDSIRTNIESLRLEQSKIGNLSTTYATLQDHQKFIEPLFLNEKRSIDFFNSLDELETGLSLDNLSYTIDTPSKKGALQVLGLHVSFNATFQNTVLAVQKLYASPVAVRITSISVANASDQHMVTVTIDGSIPWNQS